jgi:hypothetical protein
MVAVFAFLTAIRLAPDPVKKMLRHLTRSLGCLITAIAATAGCGTSSQSHETGDGGRDASIPDVGPNIEELPPIDVATPTMRIVDLSASEQISLCDWTARQLGGYGLTISCPADAADTMLAAPISLQDCVSVLQISKWGRDCPLTVQDFMACTTWQVDNICNICQAGACANGTYTVPLPAECLTLDGPLCEGAINSDASASEFADADAAGPDGSDAAPSGNEAGSDASSASDDGAIIDGAAADGSQD